MSAMRNNQAYWQGDTNYDNEKVQEIKRQFGEFKYPDTSSDGVLRVNKEEFVLENGAKYKGEWNVTTNKRDGKGQ